MTRAKQPGYSRAGRRVRVPAAAVGAGGQLGVEQRVVQAQGVARVPRVERGQARARNRRHGWRKRHATTHALEDAAMMSRARVLQRTARTSSTLSSCAECACGVRRDLISCCVIRSWTLQLATTLSSLLTVPQRSDQPSILIRSTQVAILSALRRTSSSRAARSPGSTLAYAISPLPNSTRVNSCSLQVFGTLGVGGGFALGALSSSNRLRLTRHAVHT